MSLGPLSRFKSLTEVQARSRKVLTERDNGVDPSQRARASRRWPISPPSAPSSRLPSNSRPKTHLEAHAPSWKHKYARATWFNSVKKYAYPILGDIPTNDMSLAHVAAVVSAAAADGNLATGNSSSSASGRS